MTAWWASGGFVDLLIAFTLAEALLLAWWHRRSGRGVPPREFAANLVSGLCLMAALRFVLAGAGWVAVLPWLLASGVAHGFDLWRRWQR